MSVQISPLLGVDKKLRPLVRALVETAERQGATVADFASACEAAQELMRWASRSLEVNELEEKIHSAFDE